MKFIKQFIQSSLLNILVQLIVIVIFIILLVIERPITNRDIVAAIFCAALYISSEISIQKKR